MMDVITQRRSLTAIAGGLLLSAFGAGAWSLSELPTLPASSGTNGETVFTPRNVEAENGDTSADPGLLALSLRQPLEDPPPPRSDPPPPRNVPKPKLPAAPRLEFTLLGTIIDSQRRLAIIADPSGSFVVKGVGEALELSPEGVSIQSIDSDQVTVAYNGKESTFNIDKTQKGSNVRGPKNSRGRNR